MFQWKKRPPQEGGRSVSAVLHSKTLLSVLMLTVALTWCINRLMVRPLRRIARELNDLSQQERLGHQLTLPRLHHDDEIGMLVRSYNRNQQSLVRQHDELSIQSTRFPVSELPNKAFLLAMLEQTVAEGTAQDASGLPGGAAGKTGTAQTGQFTAEGKERMNLWFAGFYPAEDPQYTIVVLQDGQTQAAVSSAAVFAQLCTALHWLG